MANDTHIKTGANKSAVRLHYSLAADKQSAKSGNPGHNLVKGGQPVKGASN